MANRNVRRWLGHGSVVLLALSLLGYSAAPGTAAPPGAMAVVAGDDTFYGAVGDSKSATLKGLTPDDPALDKEWQKRGPYWDWEWIARTGLNVTSPKGPSPLEHTSSQQQTFTATSASAGMYTLGVSVTGYRERRLPPATA